MSVVSRTALLHAISVLGLLGCFLSSAAITVADEPSYVSTNGVQSPSPPSDALGATLVGDAQPQYAQPQFVLPLGSGVGLQNSGASCGPSCCDALPCVCDSKWFVSAGAVFLERSRPVPAPIVTPSTGPGTIIGASDFGFGWNAGPDITVGRNFDNGYGIEARYFNDLSAASSFDIPDITMFRIAGIGVTILGGGPLNGTYSTALESSEINLCAALTDGCTALFGFRSIELDDRADFVIASPGITTNWHELNRMYGGQAGLDLALFSPGNPLQFNAAAKAGVFANSVDNQFTSSIVAGDTSSTTSTAFVGEVDFTASYKFTRHVAVRGGYEVLWIDKVQLAGDAAAATKQVASGSSTPLNSNGRVWYNGATAAVDFTW